MADSLRPELGQLARVAEEHALFWFNAYSPSADDLAEAMVEMVGVYTDSAALLAADWYNRIDTSSRFHATPHEEMPTDRLQNAAKWVYAGPQKPEARIRQIANKLVYDAARNTVAVNADKEGVAVVRHESDTDCVECISRATTSARAKNSTSDDVDRDFHPRCTGLLLPVRAGLWEPPGHAREWGLRVKQAREAGNVNAEDIAKYLRAH